MYECVDNDVDYDVEYDVEQHRQVTLTSTRKRLLMISERRSRQRLFPLGAGY